MSKSTHNPVHSNSSNVVALPSMTHQLNRLPEMDYDPTILHYGCQNPKSKAASEAKLRKALEQRDLASVSSQTPYPKPPPKGKGSNDGSYLMMAPKPKKPRVEE